MTNTTNLALPLVDQNQSQKAVTVNQSLVALDAVIQLSVIRDDWGAPPGTPAEGDRYIVAASATGAWAGKDGDVAAFQNGAWNFYAPLSGWRAFVATRGAMMTYASGAWAQVEAISPHGASIGVAVAEEEVTCAGATTSTTIVIPARSIVLAVSVRTTLAITGASSFDCGVSGSPSQFGGSLGVALGSNNVGVIGPAPFYSNTPIVLTAVGSNFTGGKVRVAIQYLTFTAPAS
jgi:hypothetical protein